ncbi:MAG: TIR domain-containing protein [Dehalococcoidia bacterium]|nr:TIR domain-containing protein [Dehalococcoidia bacterium]
MRDTHSALKSERIATSNKGSVSCTLVRQQWGKDDSASSLHIVPHTFTSYGIQVTDYLVHLGFHRAPCPVSVGGCFSRFVEDSLDLEAFNTALAASYQSLKSAEQALNNCGFQLEQTEGWGFFSGQPSQRVALSRSSEGGDGHTAGQSERMKETVDDDFLYVLTWLNGGPKGWTTHYRTTTGEFSPEIVGAFRFLGLKQFDTCPEFDFEQCFWRFFPFSVSRADDFFNSSAEYAGRYYDAHATHFASGVELLLSANAQMEPFGMAFIEFDDSPERRRAQELAVRTVKPSRGEHRTASVRGSTGAVLEEEFDVAISFAGSERELARTLAKAVRDAGFTVFYDDFYKTALWGKNLADLFEDIYGRRSKRCVILVSREYGARMWTNHERQSAQAHAIELKGGEYLLPIAVDATRLTGMPSTVGYVSLDETSIQDVAEMLIAKLRAL